MYDTSQFKKGLKIELEGIPYSIVEFQHVSPGKGSAFVRTRLKHLIRNTVIERTFKSGDKVDKPDMEQREVQYLYKDGDHFYFMDQTNFEQTVLDGSLLAESANYLHENLVIQVLFHNSRAIGVELPNSVVLQIVETDPGFKGDTVSGAQKIAKLESGGKVSVPLHLKEGEFVKVDTREGTYIEKVNART
jgi:elongation factor P